MSLPIMNYLLIDGRDTRDWGIGLSGSGVYNAPARDVSVIDIPGRNGAMIIDNGRYLNASVVYPCWIAKDFADKIDDFRAFISAKGDGYYRLEDSYHPDEYRLARFVAPFEAVPGVRNLTGRFNLEFDCKPQRYLKDGEAWTEERTLYNPTQYTARPTFRVYSTGAINFGDGTVTVIDMNGQEHLDIDTESYTAYAGGTLFPTAIKISASNPGFPPGECGITTTMSKVLIRPNWWAL